MPLINGFRGALAVLVTASLLAAACGDDNEETAPVTAAPSSTSNTSSTTADVVETTDATAGPDTTADVVEPGETSCGVEDQPSVTAFEVESGAVRWVSCSAGSGSWWLVGASDDLVYISVTPDDLSTGGGRSLVALDTRTGEEQWRTDLGQAFARFPSGPFPGDEVAVVVLEGLGSDTAEIIGLDPATGETIWTTSGTNGGYATNDDVVVGGGSVTTAFDRATGEQRWSVAVQGGFSGGFPSSPVISDDMVFIATVALDLQSGEERWRTAGSPPGVPGGVEDGILVWSGQDDPTSGVDVATGEILWTQPGHSTYDDVVAIGDGAVYVFGVDDGAGESTATAYDVATGETRWSRGLGPQFGPWPFLATDDFVVAVDPSVVVLSTDDGSERWSTPLDGQTPRYTGVVLNGDALFVTGAEPLEIPAPPTSGWRFATSNVRNASSCASPDFA
ncbi:MAG: PQQ-binding-like beta-propeller repeat protein [Ilumatobacteraceae bacterium]